MLMQYHSHIPKASVALPATSTVPLKNRDHYHSISSRLTRHLILMDTLNSSFILDANPTPPKYIMGVGVFRKGPNHEANASRSKKYQPYMFQSSVLVPGNHCSFPTPGLGLQLRIYCPFDSPLECPPYSHACPVKSLIFSSEGPEGLPIVQGDGLLGNGPLVIFRNDYRPLQPKQVQVLWKYLRNFKFRPDPTDSNGLMLYDRPLLSENRHHRLPPRRGRNRVTDNIHGETWYYEDFMRSYFTINNFHAFFHVTRRRRLSGGDESWRDIHSPYDDK
ncbi:uncharacterized protein LAJ45_02469 [Morchella importuna]|nr:uncharacterized protein LAJ45_02469 [Morchella importuna]KAH8153656.1 hypothetical protein LAJ45_02469 [Morchella importuna]